MTSSCHFFTAGNTLQPFYNFQTHMLLFSLLAGNSITFWEHSASGKSHAFYPNNWKKHMLHRKLCPSSYFMKWSPIFTSSINRRTFEWKYQEFLQQRNHLSSEIITTFKNSSHANKFQLPHYFFDQYQDFVHHNLKHELRSLLRLRDWF